MLNIYHAYIQVVKLQSITKAADILGVSKSTVSRLLSQMEDDWGAQLLSRSTRSIKVTEAGEKVYQHCQLILTDVDKTQQAVAAIQNNIAGTIRITAPEAFGSLCLAPIIKGFLAEYPETHLDIVLSSEYESLIQEEFDLAFRIGTLEDSTLKAKTLVKTQLGIYTHSSYLQKAKKLTTHKDLMHHNCLIYTGMPQHSSWLLALGINDASRVTGNIQSNNELFLIEMARSGQGLLLFPEILLKQHLQQGDLVQVIPDCSTSIDVNIVYPFTKTLSNKLRLFIDYVATSLQRVEDDEHKKNL